MLAGKLWRATGTGLCFFIYGTLTWLASVTLLPVLVLWPGARERRQQRIRRLTSASFRWLLGFIAFLRLGHVHIEGREWLRDAKGKLIVATHPMYLDVVALISVMPLADCVVKSALWQNRFFRRFVRVTGYLSNASSAGLVDDCARSLRQGRTLILFPEGTRTPCGEPVRLHRGAAQVAVRSGCDIMPVVIRCEPLALGKGQPWYQVADRPWRLSVEICRPRSLAELGARGDLPNGVAARRVTKHLQTFFTHQLGSNEYSDERIETTHHRLA